MTKLTVASPLSAPLKDAKQEIEISDESGATIGVFLPIDVYRQFLLDMDGCPYTEAELHRFEQETEGQELPDIWKELKEPRV
jgi:hypothetical protein